MYNNDFIFLCIKDKKLDVYKKLYQQLVREKESMEWQKEKLKELIPYKWEAFSGRPYQDSWNVLPQYYSFKFECPKEQIDMKAWREDPDGFYLPNGRYKEGRAVKIALQRINDKKNISYDWFYPLLGISQKMGRFGFPYIDYINGEIYLAVCIDIDSWKAHNGIKEITIKQWEGIIKTAVKNGTYNNFDENSSEDIVDSLNEANREMTKEMINKYQKMI